MVDHLKLHWFLPTGGDSRDVLPSGPTDQRAPDLGYLTQIARACDDLGYDALLTPTGTQCEDAWLATAALIPATERIKFLVAFRPGFLSPTLAAQMASTYQRLSGGRLLLNVVIGAEPREMSRFGDTLDKDGRYRRSGEFLDIVRHAWSGEPYDFAGEHYTVTQATTRAVPKPIPEIYFGGASPAAERIAAQHADVYLTWGEPPAMVADRLERVGKLALEERRSVRYGIRFHVITRPDADSAWRMAERLLANIDDEAIASAQADFATTQSVGQRRMADLHGGRSDSLEVYPNVWAGVGLIRGGAGTALVGSHEQVASRIEEYHQLGFREFILSGYPHLEEAYWFAEGVMPILRQRGLLADQADTAAPLSTFR